MMLDWEIAVSQEDDRIFCEVRYRGTTVSKGGFAGAAAAWAWGRIELERLAKR